MVSLKRTARRALLADDANDCQYDALEPSTPVRHPAAPGKPISRLELKPC